MELSPTNKEGLNTRATQAMISAVADSCSVRLDKVNGKVYKFHALVFNPGKLLPSSVVSRLHKLIETADY